MKVQLAVIGILLLFIETKSFCQQDAAESSDQRVVSAKLHYGSVLVHPPAIENVSGAKPFGIELEYSIQKNNRRAYNLCGCYPRAGVVAAYYNFNNKILGHSIVAGYFIEPHYKINQHTQFVLRGTAGATYVTNPYDPAANPDNHNYTVHVNPFLQLGGGINFQINKHLTLAIMESLQHFSNGGYKEPNRGVN